MFPDLAWPVLVGPVLSQRIIPNQCNQEMLALNLSAGREALRVTSVRREYEPLQCQRQRAGAFLGGCTEQSLREAPRR